MDYDFIIIGGGSAGYAAARTASGLGLRTAVVESAKEMGGLCILRGCMPSKTLLESAHRAHVIRHAEEFGLRAENFTVNGKEIIARKRRLVEEFASYRREQLQSGKFDLIRGHASFLDAHTIKVELTEGETRLIKATSFLITTGSSISHPSIPGLIETGYMTSDDVLDSEIIPRSVVVLGGGAIAVEIATYYNGLGVAVTLIQRSAQLLKEVDTDVATALADGLRKRGIIVFTNTKLEHVEQNGESKRVVFTHNGESKTADAAEIVQCLGRSPNLNGLQLANTGIADENFLTVKSTQQTTQTHIFAAGDVAGPYEVVHIAIQQGEIAARNAARIIRTTNETLEESDYRLKLYAVFSEPQVAAVGLNEKEALAQNLPVRSAQYPFNDHGKSMCMGETDGFVKLITNADSGEIVGGAVVGPHASDLIHEIVVAMHFRSTAAQLASIPHYHPTLSEIWSYPAEDLI